MTRCIQPKYRLLSSLLFGLLLFGLPGISRSHAQDASAEYTIPKEECSYVDLADYGPMKRIPVANQDGLKVCSAFAAAQTIDAYRFSHGEKNYEHLTSPLKIALDHMESQGFLQWLLANDRYNDDPKNFCE